MVKLTFGFVLLVALLAVGGAAFLALWNPPPPLAPVVKVLPDAQFPK